MITSPIPKPEPLFDEDGLGELPPLDGETEDAEGEPEELDGDDEEATDLLDDTTGEGDALEEIEHLEAEGGWLDDAADADDLDVGPNEVDDEEEREGLLEDADEPGVGEEDFGLEPAGAMATTDGGEEGPEAADEDLREEDLPRLDADDDGEVEEEILVEGWPASVGEERPPWDDRAWERATPVPGVGIARSVAPLDDGAALVAGVTLARVDDQGVAPWGGTAIHGSAIVGVARLSDGVVAATARGVFVSAAGATDVLEEAPGLGELAPGPLAEIAAHGQHIWVRSAAGAVFGSGDRGASWTLLAEEGVLALTATPSGELVVVRRAGVARGEELSPWGPALPQTPEGALPIVRARGRTVVLGILGAGAFRCDGGAWERLDGTANVTALTLLDDEGSTLVALHAAAEDRTWIARAGADGVARIVVELGGEVDEGDDPRVLDLAWNDVAKVAWAVGPFGAVVLRPR